MENTARQIRGVSLPDSATAWQGTVDTPKGSVVVAVVDATPKSPAQSDRSGHGFAVSRVVASLACHEVDSPDCRRRIRPYLAMPMNGPTDPPDYVEGGYYGHFFQLADAIAAALDGWDVSHERLIINMSLGWDAATAKVQYKIVARIRRLLEKASCLGALVFAAAGNMDGNDGPLEPAAFEALPAPDEATCELLGVPVKRSEGSGYRPLVHAVGALGFRDQRLITSRPHSLPRLAAFGMNVTVPGPPGVPYTRVLTGTSMAAAIASGIAAAIWSQRPELGADEIASMLYNSGAVLDAREHQRDAEFCLGRLTGPCPEWPIRRVSLCAALKAVSPSKATGCQASPVGDPFAQNLIPRIPDDIAQKLLRDGPSGGDISRAIEAQEE